MKNVLTTSNTKMLKGEKLGYQTSILHFAPAESSGRQVCPKASHGCVRGCLNTAGRGKFARTQAYRIAKTRRFFEEKAAFMADLHRSIQAAQRKAVREGLTVAIRLNGTSDIAWERQAYEHQGIRYQSPMDAFPTVQFYDYTKRLGRHVPANYHLTYSRSETNELDCRLALREGLNVAVVFAGALPATYLGRPVVTGDESDLRFLDPNGVIVGLTPKGDAKQDCSGFVVR